MSTVCCWLLVIFFSYGFDFTYLKIMMTHLTYLKHLPIPMFHSFLCIKDCDFYITRTCPYLTINTEFHPALYKLYIFYIFQGVAKCYKSSFGWASLLLQSEIEKWTLVLMHFIVTLMICETFARIFIAENLKAGFERMISPPFSTWISHGMGWEVICITWSHLSWWDWLSEVCKSYCLLLSRDPVL